MWNKLTNAQVVYLHQTAPNPLAALLGEPGARELAESVIGSPDTWPV